MLYEVITRFPGVYPITEAGEPFSTGGGGMPVPPGNYQVTLSLFTHGELTKLTGPEKFRILTLDNTTLPPSDRQSLAEFQQKVAALGRVVMGAEQLAIDLDKRIKTIRTAIASTPGASFTLDRKAKSIEEACRQILITFNGDESVITSYSIHYTKLYEE